MRTSQLSLAAFAFLAAASPVAKSELGNTNAFTILSADSALSKRVISGILSAGTVSINGQVGPPGSQPFPGVFVENLPQTPICDITCLDAQVRPPDSTCIKKGCTKDAKGIIFPTAVFVLKDGRTSYTGNQLVTCGVNTCLVNGGTAVDTGRPAPKAAA